MIHDPKHYPAMKDSGVPWLGEVPEHWRVARLKALCSRSALYGANVPATEYAVSGVRFLRTTDITDDGRLRGQGVFLSEDAIREYILDDGDLLISRSGTIGRSFLYDRNLHGRCAYAGYLVRFVPGACVAPAYLFLFTKTQVFASFLRVMAISSTIENVNGEKYANCAIPLPPLPEQAAIVRFLDHADRRIRRYIRSRQKLIKLLEEQKQAIIHRAVTRGLDPDVRLKPSGVEWLGDVPEHWEVRRLHQITNPDRPIMYGIVLPGPNVEEGVYIVKGGNCEPGRLRPELLSRTTFEIETRYARSRLAARDIVFAIRGSVGAAEMVPPELAGANLTQDAARIAAGAGIDPRWLLHAVRAPIFREHVKSQVVGATVRGINIRDLKRIELVVPPTEEQGQIVRHLDGATRHIVAAADRTRREIDLLREYRTRLIADVVTGKLDVREAAARLPEEVEDADALDELEPESFDEETAGDAAQGEPEGAET